MSKSIQLVSLSEAHISREHDRSASSIPSVILLENML